MQLQRAIKPRLASPDLAAVRARIASRRNWYYLKSEKLLALLFSRRAKKILLSGMPEWVDQIKNGFRRLPHQIEEGPIDEESFRRYDIVVPLCMSAMERAYRHSPPPKLAFPLPSPETLRLCDNKYELNQALIMAGFGRYIPKMARAEVLTPPYILKKHTGAWGRDCYVIRNRGDEETQLCRIGDPQYFCQEFIQGPTEFATHILFVRRRIVKALNIRYEFAGEMPIKGQDPVLYRFVYRCPYLNLFARMLRSIEFEGLCCVNYKVANGQPFVMEINPRFGGSLAPYFFSFIRHLR